MLQAIFYLSLALAASPSTGMAADLATEVLTRADASVSAAQKLQSSSKKAEAQKAAKKKAETKKAATKKSTSKKPATVAAKPKPVETAKTPWVMPDKKAIAAQRAKPQMTQVVKVATPAPAPVVTPPPAQTAIVQTPPATQTPPPATSIAAFVAPATVTPPPSSPPAPSPAASTPQASPLNPLADILPPEVISAAQTEANAPKAATAPVTATPATQTTAAAEPKAALPVVKPAPVITPEVATPTAPVLAKAVPEVKPAVVTPAPVLNAPVASNIAPPVLQPKATLPPAKAEPETTLARAVKVDTYSRDYEGPKSDRELRYDAGIAQAFGSKVGQMSSLEGSWLVSGQDGKRLLSLELRGRTGGQIDGAWRALNSGFGLNRSGLLSEAALSQSNELSVSYLERGARAPSHLKLQKSDDGRWRGTLTDGSGHATPVIMMPDQS